MNSFSEREHDSKLWLPLAVHYVHAGSDLDFPLRLVVSFSSHFAMGGKDADVLLTKSEEVFPDQSPSSSETAVWGKNCGYHFSRLLLVPKLRKLGSDGPRLSKEATLIVSIFCRMSNDHGREAWRNGGSCQFALSELVANRGLSESRNRAIFTKRKVCISAYNVTDEDRLTGLVSVALDSRSEIGTNDRKWAPSVRCVTSSGRTTCAILTRSNEPEIRTDSSSFFEALFGLKLFETPPPHEDVRLETEPTRMSNDTSDFFLRPNDESRRAGSDHWKSLVQEHWAEYREMLNGMESEMLTNDLKGTEKMRCPWVPMDTVVKEFSWDYSDPWYDDVGEGQKSSVGIGIGSVQRNPSSNAKHLWEADFNDLKSKHKESYRIGLKQQAEQTIVSHSSAKSKRETFGGSCYQEMHRCVGEERDYSKVKIDAKDKLSYGHVERTERIVYLPFPFFLCHQPLKVYKNYWGTALMYLIRRTSYPCKNFESAYGLTYESFESVFFDSTKISPQRRASLAFQLVSMYSQCIEYLSDYYTSRGKTGRKEDRKLCVEQFGNCQRALTGDCEDTSGGMVQFYSNFVCEDESKSWVQHISNNRVLSEMRRIIRHNYVVIFNIEGVYLPKQTGGEGGDEKYSMYSQGRVDTKEEFNFLKNVSEYRLLSDRQKKMVNDFHSDARDVNSAHAAVKMLPKSYFEQCVNRSYAHCDVVQYNRYGTSPRDRPSGCGPFVTNCFDATNCPCFYHRYVPDADNASLPVGFLEGTSMGCPDENVSDNCKDEKFKEYLLSDPLVNDVTKVPIYARTKGESGFYRVIFFGSVYTPQMNFLEDHGVSTFAWCRSNLASLKAGSVARPFLRSVSHKQLAFKSDKVILLPYGHKLVSFGRDRREGSIFRSPCRYVKFDFREMSSFMSDLCFSECQGRVRSRKVRKSWLSSGRYEYQFYTNPCQQREFDSTAGYSLRPYYPNSSQCHSEYAGVEYNTQLHDSGRSLEESRALLARWRDRLNLKYNKGGYRPGSVGVAGITDKLAAAFGSIVHEHQCKQERGFFTVYWDNYYVTEKFLNKIETNVDDIVRTRSQQRWGWNEAFEVMFVLEDLSDDICMWKVDFLLK